MLTDVECRHIFLHWRLHLDITSLSKNEMRRYVFSPMSSVATLRREERERAKRGKEGDPDLRCALHRDGHTAQYEAVRGHIRTSVICQKFVA